MTVVYHQKNEYLQRYFLMHIQITLEEPLELFAVEEPLELFAVEEPLELFAESLEFVAEESLEFVVGEYVLSVDLLLPGNLLARY